MQASDVQQARKSGIGREGVGKWLSLKLGDFDGFLRSQRETFQRSWELAITDSGDSRAALWHAKLASLIHPDRVLFANADRQPDPR